MVVISFSIIRSSFTRIPLLSRALMPCREMYYVISLLKGLKLFQPKYLHIDRSISRYSKNLNLLFVLVTFLQICRKVLPRDFSVFFYREILFNVIILCKSGLAFFQNKTGYHQFPGKIIYQKNDQTLSVINSTKKRLVQLGVIC